MVGCAVGEKMRTAGVHMGSKTPGDRDVGGSGLNSHIGMPGAAARLREF